MRIDHELAREAQRALSETMVEKGTLLGLAPDSAERRKRLRLTRAARRQAQSARAVVPNATSKVLEVLLGYDALSDAEAMLEMQRSALMF